MRAVCRKALVLLLALSVFAEEPEPAGLEPYRNKDLRKLDDKERRAFAKRLGELTGDDPRKPTHRPFEAWWVKRFPTGDAAWLLVQAYPGYDVPDVSGVRLHVFDKKWTRIAQDSFPTGYRYFLREVSLVEENPLKTPILVAKVSSSGPFIVNGGTRRPAFEQGNFQRQYYALHGTSFVLVRLEDDTRKALEQLAKAGNPWVKEYAALTLRTLRRGE